MFEGFEKISSDIFHMMQFLFCDVEFIEDILQGIFAYFLLIAQTDSIGEEVVHMMVVDDGK